MSFYFSFWENTTKKNEISSCVLKNNTLSRAPCEDEKKAKIMRPHRTEIKRIISSVDGDIAKIEEKIAELDDRMMRAVRSGDLAFYFSECDCVIPKMARLQNLAECLRILKEHCLWLIDFLDA
jgi:hypothetical protein